MLDFATIGRVLLMVGVVMLVLGGLFWLLGRVPGVGLGRLPGDLQMQWGNVSCFVPLATSIVLSILLTVVLNLVVRLLNR